MEYRTFIMNLSNLKRYKESLKNIENDLDLILYDLTGVKGIRYDKLPSSYNPSETAQKQLEMIEIYNEKLKEYDFTVMAIERIESVLKRLPDDLREMVIEKFVDGKSYEELGRKYGYSERGMAKMLEREVEKYL